MKSWLKIGFIFSIIGLVVGVIGIAEALSCKCTGFGCAGCGLYIMFFLPVILILVAFFPGLLNTNFMTNWSLGLILQVIIMFFIGVIVTFVAEKITNFIFKKIKTN